MRLSDYLEKNNLSDADFGGRIGVSRQAVYRYRTFDRFPGTTVLERIVQETGGAVTPNDLVQFEIPQGVA